MRKLLIVVSCFLALAVIATEAESEERFVEQPLDHFDPQNLDTWTMVRSTLCFRDFRHLIGDFIFYF